MPDVNWDSRAETYDRLAWVNRGDLVYWVAGLVEDAVRRSPAWPGLCAHPLLEVGVGTGALTEALRRVHRLRGMDLLGVDVSPKMLKRCELRLARAGLVARLAQVSPTGEVPAGPYAAVVSRMVLHHAPGHPRDMVADWVRLAAPEGGVVAVAEGPPPASDDRHPACDLYRAAMALKEPGRHVFHAHDVAEWLFAAGCRDVAVHERWTEGNSVRNWLAGGGIDGWRVEAILALHRDADPAAREAYRIEERDGDVLMRWRHAVVIGWR